MDMTDRDFLEQQRLAMERMREMKERSKLNDTPHTMPPAPSFVRVSGGNRQNRQSHTPPTVSEDVVEKQKSSPENTKIPSEPNKRQSGFFPNFKLPFSDGIRLDKDITLILGLLFILANEKADRKLLLALLYILM